jgi:hypothetical protein
MGEHGEATTAPDSEITEPVLEDIRIDSLRRENPIIRDTISKAFDKFGILKSSAADAEEEVRVAMLEARQKPDDMYVFKPEFEAGIAVDEISRLLGTSILLGQSPREVAELASGYLRQLDSLIAYLKAASGRLPVMYAHDIEGEEIGDHVDKKFLFADRETAGVIADHHPSEDVRQLIRDRVLSPNSDVRLDGPFSFSIRRPILSSEEQDLAVKPTEKSQREYKMFTKKVLVEK